MHLSDAYSSSSPTTTESTKSSSEGNTPVTCTQTLKSLVSRLVIPFGNQQKDTVSIYIFR